MQARARGSPGGRLGHSGIGPAEREMVFEPFVRLEQSRSRSTGGAGLGLAIARNVAETHGGSLTLETAPGGGTRALVTLPMFQPRAGVRPSGSDTMDSNSGCERCQTRRV